MYNIEWEPSINGVKLVWSYSDGSLAVPPRPVYKEELDLYGFNKYWHYPETDLPLCWACDRKYFYEGREIAEIAGGGIYESPIIILSERFKGLSLKPILIEKLIEMNEKALRTIEYEALNFIQTTFNRYSSAKIKRKLNGEDIDWERLTEIQNKHGKQQHVVVQKSCGSFDIVPLDYATSNNEQIIYNTNVQKFIVSFSGGKDSQVVLDLVSRVVPPSLYEVVYSDTGYEFPSSLELYEETKILYNTQYPNLNFSLVKNHQDIHFYWKNMGPPSRLHRWCCSVMKTAPIYRYLKLKSGNSKQPNVLVFEGVRSDESARRSTYLRIGKGVKHSNVVNARPIFDWNATEIYLYLLAHKLPLNKAYKQGCSRVGCIICPYSSQRSEYIVRRCYLDKLQPFLDKLRKVNVETGVNDIECYINEGKWKVRGGSKHLIDVSSKLDIISANAEKLEVMLYSPKEDFFEWIKTLGKVSYRESNGFFTGEIYSGGVPYKFRVETSTRGTSRMVFYNVKSNPALYSHILRILNKTTYCVHCETCEVECPQGALSVVPRVHIDTTKCVACKKCLDFKDKGCVMAKSLGETYSETRTMNVDRYNTFGLQEDWLSAFLSNLDNYFKTDNGLNTRRQVPALSAWLREALLLEGRDKTPTQLARSMSKLYTSRPHEVWEVIWINLCYNSNITRWFTQNTSFDTKTSPKEMIKLLGESMPERTAKNGVDALMNLAKRTMHFGLIKLNMKGRIIESVERVSARPSILAVAYSLYRYAEVNGIRQFTLRELYQTNTPGAVVKEFNAQKEYIVDAIRTLEEEFRLLHANLNMGLDNVILRDDITADEVADTLTKWRAQ